MRVWQLQNLRPPISRFEVDTTKSKLEAFTIPKRTPSVWKAVASTEIGSQHLPVKTSCCMHKVSQFGPVTNIFSMSHSCLQEWNSTCLIKIQGTFGIWIFLVFTSPRYRGSGVPHLIMHSYPRKSLHVSSPLPQNRESGRAPCQGRYESGSITKRA